MKRQKSIELIVRRGALKRYQTLSEKTGKLPVKVLWDRRVADRRTASSQTDADLRKAERRQPPPFTWDLADFVIVANQPRSRVRRRKRRTGSKKKAS